MRSKWWIPLAGFCAGAVNGLFGGGGGMLLVPMLSMYDSIKEEEIFPISVSVILPICLVSLGVTAMTAPLPWMRAVPYLAGSALGGILSGLWGRKIPTVWLHRSLGLLILWGGFRYLC